MKPEDLNLKGPYSLRGKSVLVTGASSGIGRAVVKAASELGAHLLGTGRNLEELKKTLALTNEPDRHKYFIADLAKEDDIAALAEQMPKLNGVVLNAGMVKTMPAKFIKEDLIDKLFDVNIKASILLVKYLLKGKKLVPGSSVVFISSMSSVKPTIANSVYSASKGAVNAFSKALALELAGKQIRVNTILPGLVETKILESSSVDNSQMKKHLDNYPLGRFGQPEDVAYLVTFLLGDKSSWMTGAKIRIDGGFGLS